MRRRLGSLAIVLGAISLSSCATRATAVPRLVSEERLGAPATSLGRQAKLACLYRLPFGRGSEIADLLGNLPSVERLAWVQRVGCAERAATAAIFDGISVEVGGDSCESERLLDPYSAVEIVNRPLSGVSWNRSAEERIALLRASIQDACDRARMAGEGTDVVFCVAREVLHVNRVTISGPSASESLLPLLADVCSSLELRTLDVSGEQTSTDSRSKSVTAKVMGEIGISVEFMRVLPEYFSGVHSTGFAIVPGPRVFGLGSLLRIAGSNGVQNASPHLQVRRSERRLDATALERHR